MTTKQPVTAGEARDSIEQLRQILTKEQHREVAYDEARSVGETLIAFFEVLGGAS